MTLHVILYQPEIPPNTGNIIRLCANTGAQLHLIEPLGFDINDKTCRRAGLDYREYANLKTYKNIEDFFAENQNIRVFACSSKVKTLYTEPKYQAEDGFMMGPETRGLPKDIIEQLPETQRITLPMRATSRSLNLSNATSIILYEAWRQCSFV